MRPPDRTCSEAWTPSSGPVSSRPRRRASPTPQVSRVDEEAGTAPRDHVVSKPRPDRTAVPACSSSPVAAVAQRLAVPAALAPDQGQDLLDHFAQLADPRQRRGRRHTLGAVLAVAVAAVLAGARSLAAIGEWAADAPGPVLAALGVRRHPLTGAWRSPAEATVRRVLACVDPTPWTAPSAPGWPASSHRPGRRRRPTRVGWSRWMARLCAAAATTPGRRSTCSP
jgi:hypothetical protein